MAVTAVHAGGNVPTYPSTSVEPPVSATITTPLEQAKVHQKKSQTVPTNSMGSATDARTNFFFGVPLPPLSLGHWLWLSFFSGG